MLSQLKSYKTTLLLISIILFVYVSFTFKAQAQVLLDAKLPFFAQASLQRRAMLTEFKRLVPELKKQTKVPLILPTYVPVNEISANPDVSLPTQVPIKDGHFTTFFPYLLDITADRYSISLDLTPDCMGAGACDFGYLSAEKITDTTPTVPEEFAQYTELVNTDPNRSKPPVVRSDEKPSRVKLSQGVTGFFIPYVCGANCSDSKVIWDQNGYRYLVGIEMANKKTVVEMANSAIRSSAIAP